MVSLGLVQGQMWRVRRSAPHTLHHNAPSQQRSSLSPAGGRAEVFPRQLFMTRPGKEGKEREEGEEKEEGEESQKREERTKTQQQQ